MSLATKTAAASVEPAVAATSRKKLSTKDGLPWSALPTPKNVKKTLMRKSHVCARLGNSQLLCLTMARMRRVVKASEEGTKPGA